MNLGIISGNIVGVPLTTTFRLRQFTVLVIEEHLQCPRLLSTMIDLMFTVWRSEYPADSFTAVKALSGLHRHARDQWLRAVQSIPLNIAEGNGKRSKKDRARFLGVAESQAEYKAIDDYEHEGKPEQRH